MLQVMERTRCGRLLRPHVRSSAPLNSFSFTQSPGRYGGIRVTCCRPSNDGFLRSIFNLPCVFTVFGVGCWVFGVWDSLIRTPNTQHPTPNTHFSPPPAESGPAPRPHETTAPAAAR